MESVPIECDHASGASSFYTDLYTIRWPETGVRDDIFDQSFRVVHAQIRCPVFREIQQVGYEIRDDPYVAFDHSPAGRHFLLVAAPFTRLVDVYTAVETIEYVLDRMADARRRLAGCGQTFGLDEVLTQHLDLAHILEEENSTDM